MRRVEYREPTSIPLPVLEEVINSIDDVASCLPGIAGSRRNSGSIILLVERKGILGRRRLILKLRVERGGNGLAVYRLDDSKLTIKLDVEGEKTIVSVVVEYDKHKLPLDVKALVRQLVKCLESKASSRASFSLGIRVEYREEEWARKLVDMASRGLLERVSNTKLKPKDIGVDSLITLLTALAKSDREVFVVEFESPRMLGAIVYKPSTRTIAWAQVTLVGEPSKTLRGLKALEWIFTTPNPLLVTVYRGELVEPTREARQASREAGRETARG